MDSEPNPSNSNSGAHSAEDRRSFLIRTWAVIVGGVATVVPVVLGAIPFLSVVVNRQRATPVAWQGKVRSRDSEGFIDVAEAASVDATPRLFRIIAEQFDAWTYYSSEPVGAIFLRRSGKGTDDISAFNALCPHLGCHVDYAAATNDFHCPCHDSSFTIDGGRSTDSPSARDLDSLDIKVVDGRVWVRFENYRTGREEKIPQT